MSVPLLMNVLVIWGLCKDSIVLRVYLGVASGAVLFDPSRQEFTVSKTLGTLVLGQLPTDEALPWVWQQEQEGNTLSYTHYTYSSNTANSKHYVKHKVPNT